MKLKNIFVNFICYFILAVFIGCIGSGVVFHSELQFQKSTHFTSKKTADLNPSFLFEEDEDSDDIAEFEILPHDNYFRKPLNGFNFQNESVDFPVLCNQTLKFKIPLFIHLRTLRL